MPPISVTLLRQTNIRTIFIVPQICSEQSCCEAGISSSSVQYFSFRGEVERLGTPLSRTQTSGAASCDRAGGARVPPVADVSSLARGATRKLPEAGTGSTEPPTRNRSDPPHVPDCAAPGVASRNHLPSAPRLHSRSENRLCSTETPNAS